MPRKPNAVRYNRLSSHNLIPMKEFKNHPNYEAHQEKAKTKNFLSNLMFDAGVGVAAGANTSALYTGVELAKTFISGLTAQIIFPIFILIDLLDLRNVWATFHKSKKLNNGQWKGSRNAFARAVLTSILVPLSIFVVVSSFIPGFLPGIAIALSFTGMMAARSAFNLGSGFFNLGRSKVAENPQKGLHGLQSRIQLGVGASNMMSLTATVAVFLLGGLGLATFGFAPIGIAAGVVLAGVLAYAFYKTYQDRKKVSIEMKALRARNPEAGEDEGQNSKMRRSIKRGSTLMDNHEQEQTPSQRMRLQQAQAADKKDDDFNPRAGEPNRQDSVYSSMPPAESDPHGRDGFQSISHDLMPSPDSDPNTNSFIEPGARLSDSVHGSYPPKRKGSIPEVPEKTAARSFSPTPTSE